MKAAYKAAKDEAAADKEAGRHTLRGGPLGASAPPYSVALASPRAVARGSLRAVVRGSLRAVVRGSFRAVVRGFRSTCLRRLAARVAVRLLRASGHRRISAPR